jgi:hypothetical protein
VTRVTVRRGGPRGRLCPARVRCGRVIEPVRGGGGRVRCRLRTGRRRRERWGKERRRRRRGGGRRREERLVSVVEQARVARRHAFRRAHVGCRLVPVPMPVPVPMARRRGSDPESPRRRCCAGTMLVRVASRDGRRRRSRTIRLERPPQQLVLLRGPGRVLDCGIAFLRQGGVLRDEAVVPRDEGRERAGGVVVVFDEQGRERDGCEGLFTFSRSDARGSNSRRRRHVGRVHGEGGPGSKFALCKNTVLVSGCARTGARVPLPYVWREVHGRQETSERLTRVPL